MSSSGGWQNAYSACEQRHRVLMELTEARSRMSHASHRFREKNGELEAAALEYRKAVRRLEEISAVSELGVTRGEAARRARMLEAVQTKERRLEEMERGSRGDRRQVEKSGERKLLLEDVAGAAPGVRDMGAVGWGAAASATGIDDRDEDAISPYGGASTQQLKDRQREELEAQDAGLDSLHDAIVRQKRIAEVIGGEVGVQNEILEDIGDAMDQTTQRLVDTTQNVRIVGRRDSGSWKYWLVIALLAVVIVILVSVPKK